MSSPKVYDKAKYHYEGQDFPRDLPSQQAFVHTGLFWGWLIEREMVSEETRSDFDDTIDGFKNRSITGPQAYAIVGGALVSDMLTDEGRRFSDAYFDLDGGQFLNDFLELLAADLPSSYHVKDTWDNYETLRKRIDERYVAWKNSVSP